MASITTLITGASSGFGAMTSRLLAQSGYVVYGSMRSDNTQTRASMETFSKENRCQLVPCVLDVTDDASCKAAVEFVVEKAGRIDCIIHNAGHMCYGPTEAFSGQQFLDYYNVNCVGPQRLNRFALPVMRSQKKGLLLWIGSTSTRGGTPPFSSPYFAAKAGMDALAVSYSTEVSRFGIETSIMLPGAFTSGTEHFANAGQPEDKAVIEQYFGEGKPYEGMSDKILKGLASLEPEWADVTEVGKKIVELVGMEHGTRPFRVHVDPADDGAEAVNKVADEKRVDFYKRIGMEGLLHQST